MRHPSGDAKRTRVFVVVSRPALIESRFSAVICAPIYTRRDGIETQLDVGTEAGLKHESSVHCDELVSVVKSRLTDYVGALSRGQLDRLARALRIALHVE